MMPRTFRALPYLLAFVLPAFVLAVFSPVRADSGQDTVDFYDTFNPTDFLRNLGSVHEGEIEGMGKVVVKLGLSPKKAGQFNGQYFFVHDGRDIPLEGTGEALAEPEPISGERGSPPHGGFDRPRAVWNIRARSGDDLTGEWTDRHTGKSHPFRLRNVSLKGTFRSLGFETYDDDHLPDLYRYLQIKALARPVGAEVVKEETAYQMWEDPRTGIRYPRLTRHPDPGVMARINFLLEEKQGRFAPEMRWAKEGKCENAFAKGGAEVIYLSNTLMSVMESGAFAFCTGEFHPYAHPVTFDLLRGEYLDWNRLADFFVPGRDRSGKPHPQPSPALRQWYAQHKETPQESDPRQGDDLLAEAIWEAYFIEPDTLVLASPHRCCHGQRMDAFPFSRLAPALIKPEGRRYLFPEGTTPGFRE
jgi:hypothetical protein